MDSYFLAAVMAGLIIGGACFVFTRLFYQRKVKMLYRQIHTHKSKYDKLLSENQEIKDNSGQAIKKLIDSNRQFDEFIKEFQSRLDNINRQYDT